MKNILMWNVHFTYFQKTFAILYFLFIVLLRLITMSSPQRVKSITCIIITLQSSVLIKLIELIFCAETHTNKLLLSVVVCSPYASTIMYINIETVLIWSLFPLPWKWTFDALQYSFVGKGGFLVNLCPLLYNLCYLFNQRTSFDTSTNDKRSF